MFLSIKDIGKVKKADIEIKGITVIAGENNTGKSTIGKVLYCVFNSFSEAEQQGRKERKDALERILDDFFSDMLDEPFWMFEEKESLDYIIDNTQLFLDEPKNLKYYVEQLMQHQSDAFNSEKFNNIADEFVRNLLEVLQISDEIFLKKALYRKLYLEFSRQISNIHADNDGSIKFSIRGEDVELTINNQSKVIEINNKFDLKTEAIYIDDPFVLDTNIIVKGFSLDHRQHLLDKLYNLRPNDSLIDEIVKSKKIEDIINKLEEVCPGEIMISNSDDMKYVLNKSGDSLNIKSLSAGLKTFAIIKTLLENGVIEQKGTIILDEPEIHLHPAWQLVFAEIIVLLQKNFNLHILLNTHSPYFLRAIEVYAAKHGVSSKCKYYIMRNEGDVSISEDVTENVEEIYKLLATPFQILEDAIWEDDRDSEN